MNRTVKWTAAALLALGLSALTVRTSFSAEDEDEKKATAAAQKAIMDLMAKAGTPAAVADAMKVAKAHKLEHTMRGFKPKAKGGIGIGTGLTKAGHKDSVELLIIDYAKKAPTAKEVTDYNADLVKAAQITHAISQTTLFQGPERAVGKKTPARWKELTEDMRKASADFLAAAKAKDAAKVGETAQKLNTSCTECHSIFRDDK